MYYCDHLKNVLTNFFLERGRMGERNIHERHQADSFTPHENEPLTRACALPGSEQVSSGSMDHANH